MARHPVLITSLEDDFKKIGLIAEDKTPDVAVVEEDDLGEGRQARRRGPGGRTAKRTKKTSVKRKRASKKYYKTHKSKIAKRRKKHARSSVGKKQAKLSKKFAKHSSVDDPSGGLSSLIGEVADLVTAIEGGENLESNEAIKSWANMAIISEMLGNFFDTISEGEEDLELETAFNEASETFSDLAESAAEHARGLSEGQHDEDDEDLQQTFSEHMHTLLSGLELFSDIVEGDADDDDDDEDDDDPTED
jgi:hypothetical protein